MRLGLSGTATLLLLVAANVASAQTRAQIEAMRNQMVQEEIVAAGVENERVIEAMRSTPRHEFVALRQREYAYFDMALPIGESQTISPPFVVAYMTEQLDPQPTDKVLEIGTGSGYQAAVLSPLVKEVYTIEIVPSLGRKAERTLEDLGYDNVHVKVGDGFQGWPEKAPFDKIIVTCSPEKVPLPLVEQLREGGRMVVPVGERYQQLLYLLRKKDGKMEVEALRPTLFVPMTGRAESRRQVKPDPANPQLVNGDFEEQIGEEKQAAGWHYQRQMEVIEDKLTARSGTRYAVFRNADPGRGNRALQGFAVDGRQVAELDVALWVKGDGLRFGQNRTQWPRLIVTFYDERRAAIGQSAFPPFIGTFDWKRIEKRLPVPLKAREAIFRIGLLGGTGEMWVDDIEMKAVKK